MKKEIYIKEKNTSKIRIKKRTKQNYTHIVNIDAKIITITTWRKSKLKFRLNLIINFMTLGIFHIISLFIPKLYIKIYCKQSLPTNSDFFLIEDIYNNFTLCKTIYNKSSKRKMSNNSNTQNYSKNNDNSLSISFEYKFTKYKFDVDSNSIFPIYFNLSLYSNKTIVDTFIEGIKTQDKYKRRLEKYGQNILNMNINLVYEHLIKKDIPNCLNAFVSGGICIYCNFYYFGSLLLLLPVLVLFLKVIFRYIRFNKKLSKDFSLDGIIEFKVKRKFLKDKKTSGYTKIKNIDLVPGDILILSEGEIIPCDCILLDGECILNESNILGKIETSIKTALKSDNNFFNYSKSKYCILFHGMKIVKIYSRHSHKRIVLLVINTGINTFKANQLSNLLYKNLLKEKNNGIYGFVVEKIYLAFILFLSIIAIIDIIISSFFLKKEYSVFNYISIVLSLSFMPIYYITSSFIKYIGILNLNIDRKKNIQCIDESRLIESGKINRVIFDKTGTLTENKIEISAFVPLYFDNSSLKFFFKIYEKHNIKKICEEHLIYYRNLIQRSSIRETLNTLILSNNEKKNNNHKNSFTVKNISYELSALFLQCLLCCSNLLKINNEICGNLIEKEIIDIMKWDINTVEIINDNSEEINYNNKDNSDIIIDKIHRIGSIFFNNTNNINSGYSNYDSMNIISEVFPKNYYKITEGLKMPKKKPINIRNSIIRESIGMNKNKINTFKLIILTRFFNKSYMNISCIVYNFIEDNYRFMIKGPPEKILKYCINTSFSEIDKLLIKGLKEGYKIVACATKVIEYNQNEQNQKEEYYLKDLNLCGFIFLKNKLRDESKKLIEKIINMECDVAISTGDNISNVIGVGLESGIIKERNIFVFDLNLKGSKPKIVVSNIYNDSSKDKSMEYETEYENTKRLKIAKRKDDILKRSINEKNANKKYENDLIENNKNSELSNFHIKDNLIKRKNSNNNNSNSLLNEEKQKNPYFSLSKNKDKEMPMNLNGIRESFNSYYNEQEEVNNSTNSYYFNEGSNFAPYINNRNSIIKRKGSFINFDSSRQSLKQIFPNEMVQNQYIYITQSKKIPNPLKEFHLDSSSPYRSIPSKKMSRKSNKLRKEDSELLKADNKSLLSSNQINNINGTNYPKKSKIIYNSSNSIIISNDFNHSNNGSYKKISFEYSLNKIKYFQKGCVLCLSGIAMKYIYDKRKEHEIKILLKYIKEFGKIYYSMSSFEKSLLIKINRELFNKNVCMVGDGINDIDAIMSANVGIFIGEKKNLNTLLSHYIINENNLIDIITIIKNGRGYYENDNLLLPVNAVFSSIWISLIIYCYYYNSYISNLMLSLLVLTVLTLGVIGFTVKPDYNIDFNYLASNEKLIKQFNFLQFFGMYFIKTLGQVIGIISFQKNKNISQDLSYKVLLSYIFILIWSQTMSTCLAFNVNIFYRKSILSNLLFMIFYVLIFGYIIYLLTLNDIALGNRINSVYLYFELDKENIDYIDDTHKLIFLYIILGDIVSSYGYIKILKIIFDKKANKIRQDKINNINRK